MAVNQVFSAGTIFIHDLNMVSPIGFAGLTSQSIELGNEVQTSRAFSSVYEKYAAVTKRAPTMAITTNQLKTALELVGSGGRCIKSDATNPGLDAYLLKHDECNQRDLTDSQRYRMEQGILIPETLSVGHQEVGTLSMQAIAVSKEGNEPIQESPGMTMPSDAVDDEQYGMFEQTVGGILLAGAKSLNVEFGIQVTQEDADGSIYPEWVSVGSIVSRVTIGGIDPRWLGAASIPVGGRQLTHLNTTLKIARYASDGTSSYVDLTTNAHIELTVAGLGYITTAASAADGADAATCSLTLVALHDGTNVPILIDTAAALA